jgi:type IX secretion system PorP/SprF family membrane protein
MATYSYRLEIPTDQFLYLALSAGLQQNAINFNKYNNDPTYASDPAIANKDLSSRLGFVSDFSIIYVHKGFQSGLLFSNILYSDLKYVQINTHYNPFLHFQFHALYSISIANDWEFTPLVLFRGGVDVKNQLEVAAQVKYKKKIWVSLLHRTMTTYGCGFGTMLGKGIVFNYNFNLFSDVRVNAFQNHEFTIGFKLSEIFSRKEE